MLTCRPMIAEDRERCPDGTRPALIALNCHSAIAVPIVGHGGTLGVITLMSCHPGHFGNDSLVVLLPICRMIAAAVERVKLIEDLIHRTDELQASNKELEAFTYSVSHDLRAPLRSIEGVSRFLVADYGPRLDEKGLAYVSALQTGTRQMARLIDDLLSLSRVGRIELKRMTVDMRELANDVFVHLMQAEAGRSVLFDLGDVPRAAGDHALLRHVVQNLIGNALKFTRPREHARIGFQGRVSGVEVEYRLSDNGVGFDMKFSGRLFNPFQRLHAAVEFEGTGLGLAIVHRIVHRHGGRVWAEGRVGEGATFCFTVPVAEE